MLITTIVATAQTFTVKGVVHDENGEPVIGASVMIKGSNKGTMTDLDGKFELKAIQGNERLVISYLGMKTQTVTPKASMKIVLEGNHEVLDEVMVVAFGEQKKSSFTGSAGVVDSKKLEQRQITNVMDALQGNVAGLQAYSHSGAPDASPEFRIRGISSINAGNSPLIVLDGVPYDGEWNSINPSDVASVTVLKDAASNALYGARGANGVIIVTTKKGSQSRVNINLDMKIGSSSRASKRYDTIDNPALYIETNYAALYNSYIAKGQSAYDAHVNANNTLWKPTGEGGLGYLPYAVPDGQYFVGDNGKLNPNATLGNRIYNNGNVYTILPDDWVDATYRNALRQEYNMSVTGGGQQGQFYASLGYLNAEGIAIASDYERYTGRLKASFQPTRWLNVGGNVNFARSTTNNGADVDDTEDDADNNIYSQISLIGPIYPVYLRDGDGKILNEGYGPVGDYGDGQILGSSYVRPYLKRSNGVADATLNTNNTVITTFSLNGFADIDIVDGLKATVNGSVYSSSNRMTYTYNPFYGYGYATYPNGYVYKYSYNYYSVNFQQLLKYTRSFGKHNISILAGHESYEHDYDYIYGDRENMYSYFGNQELDGATTILNNGSYKSGYNTEGWIFRGLYDWDGKYFGQVSYRRDASSRFHPDHLWGNFYSLGGAWILSKEEWMKPYKWIDMLKLKASFGQNGNDNIADFLYTDTYTINKGEGNDIGLTLKNVGNENITWETVTNINLGIEFSLVGNRLRGGLEYFYRKTTDMLCSVKVPLSQGYAGYSSNVGDMANKGVEIEVEGDPVVGNHIKWTVGANLTAYRNKILSLNADNKYNTLNGHAGYTSGSYYYGEGLPMYTWRLLKYAGVSEEGLSMWYKHDAEGNLVTTTNPTEITRDEDYFDCGTALPDFYGGFNTSVTAYGVDFSVSFAYSVGGKVMDWGYRSLMAVPTAGRTGLALHKDMLNAWSAENKDSNIPRLQYGDNYSAYTSDRFLIDGSWISLQNVSLGYTLPKTWMKSLGVSSVRLSVSGENLTYWSKRKGLDPRISSYGSVTNTKYAPARTITGGISVQF
ncbi:MAG: SusC/RagA family TonB-linked outer membrane protein [Prevotella sp.]